MTTLETKLAEALNKLHSWLVCWPITTPEDMAQSFPEMGEIAGEALAEYEREKTGQERWSWYTPAEREAGNNVEHEDPKPFGYRKR